MPYDSSPTASDDRPPRGKVMGMPTRFGALLRMKRLDSDAPKSIEDVAQEWGVGSSTLSRWERGLLPAVSHFLMICGKLGLEPRMDLLDAPVEGEDLSYYFGRPKTAHEESLSLIREQLELVILNDKTLPYGVGEPNSRLEEPHDGATWPTPREIAKRALRQIQEKEDVPD